MADLNVELQLTRIAEALEALVELKKAELEFAKVAMVRMEGRR